MGKFDLEKQQKRLIFVRMSFIVDSYLMLEIFIGIKSRCLVFFVPAKVVVKMYSFGILYEVYFFITIRCNDEF